MTSTESQPAELPANAPWFQFSLRTLLLVFVVLASSMAVFGGCGIVVFALVVGLAVHLHTAKSLGMLTYLLSVALCLPCLAGLLVPALGSARDAVRRTTCANNLKQIAMVLQMYHDAHGCFPPAYIADKNGKPMLSWRVLILPYLDRRERYKAFNLNEPWDGRGNKKLLAAYLMVYTCPGDPDAWTSGVPNTSSVAVVGPGAAWAGEKPRNRGDFQGEAGNTIMVVEVLGAGINWAEPRDLSLDALGTAGGESSALVPSSNHGPRDGFFYKYDRGSGVNVAMADGSVRYLPLGNLSTEDLRKILQVGGCTEEIRVNAALFDSGRRLNWPNITALAVWLLSVGALLYGAVRSRRPSSNSAAAPQGQEAAEA